MGPYRNQDTINTVSVCPNDVLQNRLFSLSLSLSKYLDRECLQSSPKLYLPSSMKFAKSHQEIVPMGQLDTIKDYLLKEILQILNCRWFISPSMLSPSPQGL